MTSDSPYQPPAVHPPPLTPPSPASPPRPTVVIVFGILHLVLAAYGVFGFAMLLVQPVFMNMLGRGNPALKKQMDLQAAYQWWMYVSASMS
ncbi:MAG: hypothetical protein JWO82_2423, partial [Akkermansiaceae bacterium]|nr:hypothetical protein [Akkermansiaceae bacterium]